MDNVETWMDYMNESLTADERNIVTEHLAEQALEQRNEIIATLRAKLAEVEGERDDDAFRFAQYEGWLQERDNKIIILENLRDSLEARLTAIPELKGQLELAMEERDDARRWAAAWKRSAKMWRGSAEHYASWNEGWGDVKGDSAIDRLNRVGRQVYFWWCRG